MKNNVKCALAILTSMIALCITGGSAHAFDTGHHADLTREALAEVGMSNTAIQICQVENWLVDYYSVSPTSSDGIVREVAKLHADNLFSEQAVTNYWDRYAVNAKKPLMTQPAPITPSRSWHS
jgi:hypothetical protein